jgi:hypothetical protein
MKKLMIRSRKSNLTYLGIRCADHVNPHPQNLALTSPTNGSVSVEIVRLRTKATDFLVVIRTYFGYGK